MTPRSGVWGLRPWGEGAIFRDGKNQRKNWLQRVRSGSRKSQGLLSGHRIHRSTGQGRARAPGEKLAPAMGSGALVPRAGRHRLRWEYRQGRLKNQVWGCSQFQGVGDEQRAARSLGRGSQGKNMTRRQGDGDPVKC